MGDPKRFRKKYSTPRHPWKAEVIEIDKVLLKEYGLRNKKEIWKMNSILKKYKDLAKKLIAVKTEQGKKEKKQMLDKLQRWGLIEAGAELDAVLGLKIKDIMERRLQSLIFRKSLARSMGQARQFIIHRHIMVGDKKITFPSAIISREEEAQIRFDPRSSISQEEHPERVLLKEEAREEEVEVLRKKEKEKPEEKKLSKKGLENSKNSQKEMKEIPSAEELIKETKERFEK